MEIRDIDGFLASDIDTAADPRYYGYVNNNGQWYIMEENSAAGTFRFASGDTGYTTNWTNRASLSYDYFYNL